MKVIRKRLYESEGLAASVRWDETCSCVQSLFDGTWVDNPTADPRYNPANLAPPNATADPRCSAAYGMRVKIENIMDAFFLAQSLIEAANAVLALITITLPGVGLIWRVVFAVIEALIAIGSAALIAAFTEAAYDELQCIFYAEISADGQMTQAQFETINTRICDDMDVTICAALGLIMNMLGYVGMSNAGAMFGTDGDCDDCPIDWCFTWIFSEGAGAWVGFNFPIPAVYSGGAWRSQQQSGGTYCSIEIDIPIDSVITEFSASGVETGSYPTSGSATTLSYVQGGNPGTFVTAQPTGDFDMSWAGTAVNLQKLRFTSQINGLVSMEINQITVRGTGTNPFGDTNCPP